MYAGRYEDKVSLSYIINGDTVHARIRVGPCHARGLSL